MIYLDSAATSLWHPKEAEERMIQALRGCGNAGRGAHDATLDAGRIVFETRMRLAELFHAESPERIAFTCNDTEALNTAIFGLFGPGDHVITTVCEHNSVLRPLYALEKQGLELSVIPADVSGRIDYDQMEAAVRKNTKAFVVTHASNLTGNITDLARVCEIAERHSLRLIVDAAQTAGILPIDVQKSGIDVLCFSGHKGLLGPQGTGGIYVRPELSIRPLKMGGSGIRSYEKEQPAAMPEHLEAGTLNVHGIAGLLGALEYLEKTGIEMIYKRERELMHLFLEKIQGIPGLTLYGTDDLQQRVPTAALNIGSCDSGYVSDWLYENYGIAVRSGAHCAPLMHEALGTREQGAVRFSFSHVLTEEEVRIAAQALREFAEEEMQQRERRQPASGIQKKLEKGRNDMRQRKETWILTFAGTTQAMQMEQYARAHGLPGRMIPVPREITAGCGLSWKAAPEEGKEILAALQTAGLAYEAEYRVLL